MTAPAATPTRPEVVTRGAQAELAPWIEQATSADHKRVGLLYIATALSFLTVAAVEFALLRLQLIVPENSMIEPEIFNRLLSTAATARKESAVAM